MAEGKIILSGFNLEPVEKAVVNDLIENYQNKIREKIDYKELRLRLKSSKHGKAFLHEIQGTLLTDKMFNTIVTDYNLFSAIAETLEKLMHEAEHHLRTRRQLR